ncbi:MAG: hypothetical protein HY817_05715 [Candidatus Abawacabacteria bacterium]|nr:hypothetical protein [Candidatus Abawacabacteria bacterium]
MLTAPIIVQNTVQLRDTQLEIALDQAENIAIATASPIRNYINKEVFKRIQHQFIEHLKLNKSQVDTYTCQDQPTPTEKNGGSLLQQYGLCNPVRIMEGLDGDTNQTIDFLSFAYPNHKQKLDDLYKDGLRKSIVEQAQNTYDYSLRSTYVGQQTLFSGAGERFNRYRYMVRADVETHTYHSITNQIVIHFDVVVDEIYYPISFDGGNCDQQITVPPDIPVPPLILNANTENALLCKDGFDCKPVGIEVRDENGNLQNCPYGSPCYKEHCGNDPYCGLRPGQACQIPPGVTRFECPRPGGVTYFGDIRPLNIRPTRGCVSASTFDSSSTGLDPDGYTFTVTTRLVSLGSTYN